MTGEKAQSDREIFKQALKLPPRDRGRYLDEVCGDDSDLRQDIKSLLEAHEAASGFMERPALAQPVEVVDRTFGYEPLAEQPGTVIGPYKLLQQIGEGGMGVVFMAEQTEPIQRTVALKIIKPGMDTRQVIARFEAERQALAMMDHPNIAKVLDAGTTDTGRPYFVMELVKGVPITKYCDEKQLSIRERLELFKPVCEAVQHAHQKGIIHRDLKPTNVLVAEYDNRAVPKVIDFGVAKATAQKLTERTMFTEFGQVIGTFEYMSPEQAKFNQIDVDTRSDVYSLGVLLYELLTASTPFERERLREAAFDEALRIIREEDPPPPSTRLSAIETLPSVAANRQAEPARLNKDVRGELDWIVMKSLEKDRDRRYQTVSALADDIQNYLADQPVTASPPSSAYRLRKFVRRNKVGVLAGSAVVAALFAGAVLASIGFVQARRQAARADFEADAARTQSARSDEVAQFLKDMLQAVAPSVAMGRDTAMLRDIADRTAERLRDLNDQPAVKAELCTTLGTVYVDLGEYTPAEAMHREALQLRRSVLGIDNTEVADCLVSLGETLRLTNEFQEAQDLFEEALALRRRLPGDNHAEVAYIHFELGLLFNRQNNGRAAEEHFRKALIIQQKLPARNPVQEAQILRQLGLALSYQGKLEEAETVSREGLAIHRSADGNSLKTAYALHNLAFVLRNEKKYDEAEQLFREALAIRRKFLGIAHPNLAESLLNLAELLRLERQFAEAESLCREGLEMRKKLFGAQSTRLASPIFTLGQIAEDQGDLDEAEMRYHEALALNPADFEFPNTRQINEALHRIETEKQNPPTKPGESSSK